MLQVSTERWDRRVEQGRALLAANQLEQAEIAFREVLTHQPHHAGAMAGLAQVAAAAGQLDEAIRIIRRAIESEPQFARHHFQLGNYLMERARSEEAIETYRRALVLDPDLLDAQTNLAAAAVMLNRHDEAMDLLRGVLERDDTAVNAHCNIGTLYRRKGDMDQALAHYRRAVELRPQSGKLLSNLGSLLMDMGELHEAIDCFECAIKLEPLQSIWGNLLFAMQYDERFSAEDIGGRARFWGEAVRRALPDTPSHANVRNPGKKLRIGYVSADFRDHVNAFYTLPLFRNHNRESFEIYAYSFAGVGDNITAQHRALVDGWRDVTGLSDQHVAEQIRGDGIDILVDLAMHMAGNRIWVFALRPAPVQACWLAYPGTTGLPMMDYRISDAWLDPIGVDERVYSERTVQLPDTFWCYHPIIPGGTVEVSELPALQTGRVTFGCLNNFVKVRPQTLHAWARILQAVPGSRLILMAGEGAHRERTLQVFEQAGIERARIEFAGRRFRRDYYALYREIDLCLDTLPYNGHTTSLDAMLMGVPVVTQAGRTVVGRAGVSQLTNLGLEELIARDEQEFVRIAVELAHNLPRLAEIRRGLRGRMEKSPLMDAAKFARNMEDAYQAMWRDCCARPVD